MKSINSLILFVGLIAWGSLTFAQPDAPATRNYSGEAGKLWESGAYSQAAEAYKLAAEKINPKNDKARQKRDSTLTCLVVVMNCFTTTKQQSNNMRKRSF